ncbi:hypothetical protein MML48_6g00000461 [Holotrichia oblita]|uniref:Uncharacterized protein n=1 Tax=Holotrichia oblita TaxID=644536 RepID=A0ACB9SWV9_HOLOL|nr:hypothetical protein MML48_6g00000461 [Holotrichia oblita]
MHWRVVEYIFLMVLPIVITTTNVTLHRSKRWLVYPFGGQVKVVVGISWPVRLGSKQEMSCSLNLQFQFPQAQNITQLHQFPPIISRSTRDKREEENRMSDRMMAYIGVEEILNRYGMDGHNCLLRNICENAMYSVNHEVNGIYGKLLHIFLSPDYGDGEVDEDLDVAYVDAQKAGYYGVDCFSLYPGCPYGGAVLDLISTLW